MAPPPNPTQPPSQDEARQALELLMKVFEHQPRGVELQEYMTMGKLMEKLNFNGAQANLNFPGGMHPMERADGTLPLGRKRSIQDVT